MIGIVINPISGGARARLLMQQVILYLSGIGKDYKLYESSSPGGIEEKTKEAVMDGVNSVILAGGDGSLSEAVGELVNRNVELLLLPCGTGNDFARALRLPKDPIEALKAQFAGKQKKIDCGMVNGRVFANVSGSGFDVDVLRRFEELKTVFPGEKAYRHAVMDVIVRYHPFSPQVEIDGKPISDSKYAIVEIANGQYFGGGMKVAPDAKIDDGFFDVVFVRAVPRMLIPLLLPLFISGIHTRIPLARVVHARSVVMRKSGMTINIDGQLTEVDEARYEIIPGGLLMRLPV